MTMRRALGAWAALCTALLAFASAAAAQTYPSKTVRIIAPFPAGGLADVLARAVGEDLQKSLGQSVIVENRPGAGGNTGANAVATADPDGHTLLLSSAGILSINEFIFSKMPFDPDKAFAPVTVIADMSMLMVVHPKVGVSDSCLPTILSTTLTFDLLKRLGLHAKLGDWLRPVRLGSADRSPIILRSALVTH